MATTKLTLSVEPDMIAKAKNYASKHHISVSKLFSDFIGNVTAKEDADEDPFLKKIKAMKVSPEIEKLTGILKGKVPEDINLWDAKYEYLKEKHGL